MKKFLVLLVVVAMSCLSSVAFAADIAVSGSTEMLLRSFQNLDMNDTTKDNKNFTQERVRLNIDAKAGDAVSGRIGIENDWDTWGGGDGTVASNRFEQSQANGKGGSKQGGFLMLREAYLGFRMPDTTVGVKAGHMLLQLGNAWFFRSMKYGDDAWVVYTDLDALHLGVVNIKVAENNLSMADDTDAYAFVATYKLSDTMSAGLNFTNVNDRNGRFLTAAYSNATTTNPSVFNGAVFENANLQNLEVHVAGKVGPAQLKAEVDIQSGDATTGATKHKFKGNQVVLQAAIAMDPVTINATVARGSGATTTGAAADSDVKEYIALMDADVHYTLIYEYLVKTAARQSFKSTGTGFGNTTAVSLGAGFNVSKNLMIGADVWMLQATEKVNYGVAGVADSNDLGTEIDAKINWKMYENLTFNTSIGYFMPGDAYKRSATADADAVTAIQSVLSFKF